jgi:hypothetical protein
MMTTLFDFQQPHTVTATVTVTSSDAYPTGPSPPFILCSLGQRIVLPDQVCTEEGEFRCRRGEDMIIIIHSVIKSSQNTLITKASISDTSLLR